MAEDAPTTTRRWSRRRVAVVTGVLAVAVCAGAVWTLREPVLVEWHSRRLASEDEAVRLDAAERLVSTGTVEAVEPVVEWLRARRDKVLTEHGEPEFPPNFQSVLSSDEEANALVSDLTRQGASQFSRLLSRLDDVLAMEVASILQRTDWEDACPILAECLQHDDPRIRFLAVRAFACPSVVACGEFTDRRVVPALSPLLDDPDPSVQSAAACALGSMFPGKLDVRDGIRRALAGENRDLRWWSLFPLSRSDKGRCALPELIAALEDKEEHVRLKTTWILQGTRSPEALAAFKTRLEHVVGEERERVIIGIGRLAEHLPDKTICATIVPKLIDILEQSQNPDTDDCRENTVWTLNKIGPAAGAAAPVLHRLLETRPEWTLEVCEALARLGPEAQVRVDDLVSALEPTVYHVDPSKLGNVICAMDSLGSRAKPAVPFLIRILNDENVDVDVRTEAAYTLGEVAPDDPTVHAALVACVARRRGLRRIRRAAASSLGRCTPSSTAMRATLEKALRDPTEEPLVRGAAARSLGVLATADTAQATMKALLDTLAHRENMEEVLDEVVEGLGAMGPLASEAVSVLQDGLRSDWPIASRKIAMALWRIDSSQASVALDVLLRDIRNHGFGWQVLDDIAEMGGLAAPATAPLILLMVEAMRDTFHDEVDEIAAITDTIRAIGEQAVPHLVEALSSQDILVRVRAVEILGLIGPDAIDAVPALEKALDDPDAEVRREAKKALERIRGVR